MTFFDDEEKAIKYIQSINLFEIEFVNYSPGLLLFFISVYFRFLYRNWINNTEGQYPPDFINHKKEYMMEMMRFDDYEDNGFSQNAVESKRTKELIKDYKNRYGKNTDLSRVLFIPNLLLNKESVNSIDLYYENYKRVLSKHSKKILSYKKNYPNYVLAFLLFDESPAYIETEKRIEHTIKPGDCSGPARYYVPLYDRKFVDLLVRLDVKYVLWAMPYKETFFNSRRGLKKLYLVDIDRLKQKQKYINYDYKKVYCIEVDDEQQEEEQNK